MTNEALAYCLLGFTKEQALPALKECGFTCKNRDEEKGENIEAFCRGDEGMIIYYTQHIISEVYFFLTGEWFSSDDIIYH